MPSNPIYTESGLREISRVVTYYLNRKCFDPRNTSNPRPSKRELSRQIASYRTPGGEDPPKNDASMDRLLNGYMPGVSQPLPEYLDSIGGMFPIPGTELPDDVGGQGAEEIFFDKYSFFALARGQINLCTTEQMVAIMTGGNLEDIGMAPLTLEIERLRRKRRHSYGKLCEVCGISPADVCIVRRLIYFNGWAVEFADGFQLSIQLSSYLDGVQHGTPEPFKKMAALLQASRS